VRDCGECHECGTPLVAVLDGEEWCPKCQQYRRYRSHGWIGAGIDRTPCPEPSDAHLEADYEDRINGGLDIDP
jgi:hypothetical protein